MKRVKSVNHGVVVVLVLGVFCSAGYCQPWLGSGTEGDPYQIWTAEDMQGQGVELGLIGFVFAFGENKAVLINHFNTRVYVNIVGGKIGFVLRFLILLVEAIPPDALSLKIGCTVPPSTWAGG